MKFVTDKEPKQPVETDQEVIFTYDVLFQVRRQYRGVTRTRHPFQPSQLPVSVSQMLPVL